MSKIVYYLGAGASYGEERIVYPTAPNEVGEIEIKSGLPIVSEIVGRLAIFYEYIKNIQTNVKNNIIRIWGISFSEVTRALNDSKSELLDDIAWLQNETIKHATIDTFAKKLYLSGNIRGFNRLEKVLCTYFVWEQIDHPGDQRYDTFLANVLTEDELQLPLEISVVSWNYDSQFEIAYSNYTNKKLYVYDKYSKVESLPNCGRIFKVNGSASFRSIPTPMEIKAETLDYGVSLLWYYHMCNTQTDIYNFEQIEPRLSFAWEKVEENSNMMEAVKQTVQDARALVVIGYSFPFFNRLVDRQIFRFMSRLHTIYIQDPYADDIKQNIQNVLSDIHKANNINIIPKTKCGQFFLPPEL